MPALKNTYLYSKRPIFSLSEFCRFFLNPKMLAQNSRGLRDCLELAFGDSARCHRVVGEGGETAVGVEEDTLCAKERDGPFRLGHDFIEALDPLVLLVNHADADVLVISPARGVANSSIKMPTLSCWKSGNSGRYLMFIHGMFSVVDDICHNSYPIASKKSSKLHDPFIFNVAILHAKLYGLFNSYIRKPCAVAPPPCAWQGGLTPPVASPCFALLFSCN